MQDRRVAEEAAVGYHEPVTLETHNPLCAGFREFMADTVLNYVQTGAVRCLGKYADVKGTSVEPWLYHSLTVEPTKPRLCAFFSGFKRGNRVPG